MSKGLSLAAYLPDNPGELVGVAILDEKRKGEEENLDGQKYPQTFRRLLHFFDDLSTNYGSLDIFEQMKVMPIFLGP